MSYSLERFVTAQENTYKNALVEMQQGKKKSHWMWFIFPQIKGLGYSETAKKYAIENEEEAKLYLQNRNLTPRLLELTTILFYKIHYKTAEEIFGFPDYLKFQSSMTLFKYVVENNRVLFASAGYLIFEKALLKYFDGKTDDATIEILRS